MSFIYFFKQGLFRKILNRRIRPYQLVRMTPEELASQELSKWREHETKHVSAEDIFRLPKL